MCLAHNPWALSPATTTKKPQTKNQFQWQSGETAREENRSLDSQVSFYSDGSFQLGNGAVSALYVYTLCVEDSHIL